MLLHCFICTYMYAPIVLKIADQVDSAFYQPPEEVICFLKFLWSPSVWTLNSSCMAFKLNIIYFARTDIQQNCSNIQIFLWLLLWKETRSHMQNADVQFDDHKPLHYQKLGNKSGLFPLIFHVHDIIIIFHFRIS